MTANVKVPLILSVAAFCLSGVALVMAVWVPPALLVAYPSGLMAIVFGLTACAGVI